MKDITGQKFGRLTAVRFDHKKNNRYPNWLFKCECGKEKIIDYTNVIKGKSRSCGCLLAEWGVNKRVNITGKKFGRWTAIKFIEIKNNNPIWLFKCECGKELNVSKGSVMNGGSISCGCYLNEMLSNRATHRMVFTRFYRIWSNMLTRCTNPKATDYHRYGGRGIKVCDRWLKFENFRDDIYENYLVHVKELGEKQTTIDRIDVNGNYEINNIRLATYKEQARNRRKNKLVTFKKEIRCLAEWSEVLGISYSVLQYRIKSNWPIERAFTEAVAKK